MAIGRAEWHDIISPFYGIRALKRQLKLTLDGNPKLMISLGCIPEPHKTVRPASKFAMNCRITMGDRVSDDPHYHIEWDIIDTETPHKILDIADVLLVGLKR